MVAVEVAPEPVDSGGARVDTSPRTVYWREYKRSKRRPDVLDLGSLVNTGSLRSHLEELRAVGVGVPTIARASGVSKATIDKIRTGARRRCTVATRDALLAVFPSDSPFVPAAPVRAQVDALLATRRWSGRALARAVHGGQASQVVLGAEKVSRRTADRVQQLARAAGLIVDEPCGDLGSDPIEGFRLLLVERQSLAWRARGACRKVTIPDPRNSPFFPGRGTSACAALAVCARCTVRVECLSFALDHEELGVWASTGEQRREIKALDLSVDALREAGLGEEGFDLAGFLRAAREAVAV